MTQLQGLNLQHVSIRRNANASWQYICMRMEQRAKGRLGARGGRVALGTGDETLPREGGELIPLGWLAVDKAGRVIVPLEVAKL